MTAKQPLTSNLAAGEKIAIDKYFNALIKMQGSDLHLKAGQVPRIRVAGTLHQTTSKALTKEEIENMVFEILSPGQKAFFLENGTLDFAYDTGLTDRFRVNVYRSRGDIAIAARRVTSIIPSFESLHLPEAIMKISEARQGLVLVTGVTSSGKSTTITAMLDHINKTRACHIVTIEDPIEFIFKDEKALFSQREIGIDVPTYEDALFSLMREDPDVVLIGEMRDYTTLTAGLQAAETGHLVFAAMHSVDAYQTITHMLDTAPQAERHIVRQALLGNLHAIISQKLLPSTRKDVALVPALEILIVNAPARKLIAEEREVELPTVIKSSYSEGMIDYTESLRQLIENDYVDLKTAYHFAPNKEELKMALKGIRAGDGGILS